MVALLASLLALALLGWALTAARLLFTQELLRRAEANAEPDTLMSGVSTGPPGDGEWTGCLTYDGIKINGGAWVQILDGTFPVVWEGERGWCVGPVPLAACGEAVLVEPPADARYGRDEEGHRLLPFTEQHLRANILRAWPWEQTARFARHLLGEEAQAATAPDVWPWAPVRMVDASPGEDAIVPPHPTTRGL